MHTKYFPIPNVLIENQIRLHVIDSMVLYSGDGLVSSQIHEKRAK